jgi:hypothetical protein
MPRIIVAGHLCLDIIPNLHTLPVATMGLPGRLHEDGTTDHRLGGAVRQYGTRTLHVRQ